MSTMTTDLPVYRESDSRTTRPRAVPDRVGFWRGLWNTVKNSAIFVATARAVDGVIGWFTSGEATHTVRRAGSWIADTASSFWNWSTGLLRRTPPLPVTETAAAPFRWLSWAGLWTMAGITAGLALVVSAFNWVADRWNNRTPNTVASPVLDRDPMVPPRTSDSPADWEKGSTITIKGRQIPLPNLDMEFGDYNKAYNWKRLLQVDSPQELADLVYGDMAKNRELHTRLNQIEQDSDHLEALQVIHIFNLALNHRGERNHEFVSEWFGRLDCYSWFYNDKAVKFFSTDEDDLDGGKVLSLQEKAESRAQQFLAQRRNKSKDYTWFRKPKFMDGFRDQGKDLEAIHTVAGHVA